MVRNLTSSSTVNSPIASKSPNTANCVPFFVPGLSTSSSSSSSPTSPTSSSQETVASTEHPASTRSESMSEEVQGNLSRGPAAPKNSNKNEDNEEVRGNLSHDLPEWLQEFRHGLVDERVPEHRDASSSSHELPSEPRAKVVPGKAQHFYSLPEKRTGTVVPRADNIGDLITADHKVLSEGRESKQPPIRCSGTRLGNTVDTSGQYR